MTAPRDFNPGLSHRFYFMRKGLRAAIQKNASHLSGTMLDFGCGSKPYKSLINVDKYIGIDYENPGHDHSQEEIDVYYDGKTIPFSDEYFDSALCTEVLEHLSDVDNTIKELGRVLKKGGKMLVTCPFVWNEHEIPYDYARYTQFALKDMFEKNGFRLISYEKKGNFIEAIAQMRVLYFIEWSHSFFSKISFLGSWISNAIIFCMNGWGKIKSKLFPSRHDLYLSNVLLVEKNS
jgi:SAM-dependent methyltransferase